MTQKQADKIWKLVLELQVSAILFGGSERGTEDHKQRSINLMKAKSRLYKYLKENTDDTENL